MTVLCSIATVDLLVVTADSSVTNTYANGEVEYETGRKWQVLDGIGYVASWGDRVGNNYIRQLDRWRQTESTRSVEDVAREVER